MSYPSIKHGPDGEKKLVKDEGEMLDAYNAGFKDSPSAFTPEAIAKEKARLIVEKADAEKAEKARIRGEKAEALLVAQEKAESLKKKK